MMRMLHADRFYIRKTNAEALQREFAADGLGLQFSNRDPGGMLVKSRLLWGVRC